MKNSLLKKLTALALCLLMLLPVVSSGFAPLSALLDGVALQADAAISGIKIVVPETIYLEPKADASTKGQYYVNNNADGSVNAATATTGTVYVAGATVNSVSIKSSTDLLTWSAGTLSNTSLPGNTNVTLGTGVNAGGTALVEWEFNLTVNGKNETHYAYSVAYAPWYLPVGAAAHADASYHDPHAGSILWVSGVHGYKDGDRANTYYVNTSHFLPMLGTITAPNNENPDSKWVQSGSNGFAATMSYVNNSKDGAATGDYHVRSNVIGPTATLTVDTSRYNNFNQIPNFKVGFMITNQKNATHDASGYHVSDYTGKNDGYNSNTANSSSQYSTEFGYKGTVIKEETGSYMGAPRYNGVWNKEIRGTADFRIKSAVKSFYDAIIDTTAWNNNFVNISVTGANKATLRTNVLNGTSYGKENYTTNSWNAYQAELRNAALKLGNPVSSDVDTSNLTAKEAELATTVYFDGNGGDATVTAESVVYAIGGKATETFDQATAQSASTASRTGYTFLGWSTDKNATSVPANVVLDFNDTLYAVWQANTYTVTFDNLIDFKSWNTTTASNAAISNVTDNGFTLTCNNGAGEGTSASPFFAVEPGKQYKISMDFTGDNWDVYIFFCDANGNWIDFADGPTNRYSSNGSTGIPKDNAVFTAPNKSEVVKAQIRVDANGANNAVRFENIRVYEVGKVVDANASYEKSVSVTYDSSYGTLLTPTRTGYTFAGWVDANGNAVKTGDTVKTASDHVLYSTWTINQYTITFDTDGGSTIAPITQDYNTAITAPANPTKTGYTFAGWDKEIPANMPAENITIKAKWNINPYTIHFDSDGGSAVAPITQDYNTAVTAPAPPTKTGYTFAGWDKEIPANMPAENITIKAKWTINQYTITFDTDGGTAIPAITQDYNTAVTAPADPTKEGFVFDGWDKEIPANMPAEDIKITAKWESSNANYKVVYYLENIDGNGYTATETIAEIFTFSGTSLDIAALQKEFTGFTFDKVTDQNGTVLGNTLVLPKGATEIQFYFTRNSYTVRFDSNGGTGTMADLTVAYGASVNLTANVFAKTGYSFAGWECNGTTYADKQAIESLTAENGAVLTFTAQWTINQYTITFDTDGGSAIAPITQDYNTAVTAPSDPTKTGYSFDKWDKQIPSNMPAENITIKAEWKINQYTITFDTDGGSDVAPITQDYNTAVTAPANPTKEGYDFVAWDTEIPATMPAENITIKAIWEVHKFTITFDSNGGSAVEPIRQDYGTAIEKPANPTKEGFDFICWLKDGEEYAIPDTMPAEDITLTAKWEIKTYTITFANTGDAAIDPIKQEFDTAIRRPQNPTRVGYTFTGWDRPIPATMPAENITITATWSPNNNTLYKVEHYQQDIGTDTYTLFETETLKGVTDTDVTPAFKTYAGFTGKGETITEKILPDGSLTIQYYYTRNNYTVTFDSNGGEPVEAKTFAYGETINLTEDPIYVGYIFTGWNPALPKTMPAGNLHVTAGWIPNPDTPYTVYHHYQDTDLISYPDSLTEMEICYGETGSIVEVAIREKFGFTAPEKRSIVIAADGTRTVRYYYTRNSYSVTFVDYNDKILSLQTVVYETAATPPALTGREAIADGHYVFMGWTSDPTVIKGNTTCKAQYELVAHTGTEVTDCTTEQVCTVCGYVMKEANGHTPVVTRPAVAPTCTEPGNSADSYCELCGIVLSTYQILPATGHKVGSWYVDVPATETSTGVIKRVCANCDLFETHEIPVLSDKPVTSVDITTQGSQAYIGTSYQLKTSIQPADAPNKQILWESSDPSVATVSADGYITSRKPGEVTFTALTLDGLKTDSITVNFFYSSSTYSILVLDLFGCELYLDGKKVNQTMTDVVSVKAGSTLAFTLNPTTTEYLEQGGYILTANGSNVKPDANGVYYIYNVYENIEITALPMIGKPEFDDDQHYDSDEVPKKSIFAKILEFFERIMEWFRNLFK